MTSSQDRPAATGNPWDVETIMEFNFYSCPECDFRHRDASSFIDHAVEQHERAKPIWTPRRRAMVVNDQTVDWELEASEGSLDKIVTEWEEREEAKAADTPANDGSTSNFKEPVAKILPDNRAICLLCNCVYMSLEFVVAHRLRDHKRDIKKLEMRKTNPDCDSPAVRKYSCTHCPEVFEDKFKLDTHIVLTKTNVKINSTCEECNVEVKGVKNWKLHLVNVHNDETLGLLCPKCPNKKKRFLNKIPYEKHYRKVHMKKAAGDHACSMCGKKYREASSLSKHKKTHKDAAGKDKCPLCGITVQKQHLLGFHIRKTHPDFDAKSVDLDDGTVFCPECLACLSKDELDRHRLETHMVGVERTNIQCDVCDKPMASRSHLDLHKKTVHIDGRSACCDICSVGFKTGRELKVHMTRRHPNENRAACKMCDVIVFDEASLTIHVKSEHPDARQSYECNACNKSLTSKTSLYLHKKRNACSSYAALSGKKHRCHVCGHVGSSYRDLKAHMVSNHEGQKCRYQCSHCKTIFSSDTAMLTHKKNVCQHSRLPKQESKPDSGSKCSCKYCGKVCLSYMTMKRHVFYNHKRTETEFVCEQCGLSFFRKADLGQHGVKHQKYRPHACNDCGKTFKEEWHIQKHRIAKHQDASGLACQVCGSVGSTHAELVRHYAAVHPDVDSTKPDCVNVDVSQ